MTETRTPQGEKTPVRPFVALYGVLGSFAFWLYVVENTPRQDGMLFLGVVGHWLLWLGTHGMCKTNTRRWGLFVGALVLPIAGELLKPAPADQHQVMHARPGDLAKEGGRATVRKPFKIPNDDPATTNDESNDQPLGHFGTATVDVCNASSGNCYPLDADIHGSTVKRLYFPKGGWVDFYFCEIDEYFGGQCEDENGTEWIFAGRY